MKKLNILIFAFLFFSIIARGQKEFLIEHDYRNKVNKPYNLDGAELFLIVNNDTLFIPKVSRYKFLTSFQLDSIALNQQSKMIHFLIKTFKRLYLLKIDKEKYLEFSEFEFEIWIDYDGNSFSSVTFPTAWSYTYPAIIRTNKEWKGKFYPYQGTDK